MIAALYVETQGPYFGLPGVDPWDEARDARTYPGPHPIVAHPPCQRWGRFWHGSTRKPHQFAKGEDGGCFAAAFQAVNQFGGVIEHPCDSHAWDAFGIPRPPRAGGWISAGMGYGSPQAWTCCVYQGHYGHLAGKPTWLYVSGLKRDQLPALRWGKLTLVWPAMPGFTDVVDPWAYRGYPSIERLREAFEKINAALATPEKSAGNDGAEADNEVRDLIT